MSTPGPHAAEQVAQADRLKVIVSTSIANALEWFDFVAFAFFAVIMAKHFFPASNQLASLLAIFATFAIPFAVRPFGAFVLGAYADRHGRKTTLVLTIALMTLGTAIMAAVPTYESIGAWAAVFVVVSRMIQAFSVGGEYGAAVAFLVEQSDERRGFMASWHYSSQSMTAVMAASFATLLHATLTPDQINSWGWRLPFCFGLLIAPVGFYVRTRLHESNLFLVEAGSRTSVLKVLAKNRPEVALAACVIAASAVAVYMVLFMPTFAMTQLGLPSSVAFLGSLLAGTILTVLIPVFGLLSDRYDRKSLLLASSLAVLIVSYPLFAFLVAAPSVAALLGVQSVLAVINAINLGCLGSFVAELFPTDVRSSGLSLANALTQMTIGGTTPFVSVWLIQLTGQPTAPAFDLMLGAAISVAALIALRPKQVGRA